MAENIIVVDIPICQNCGHDQTITQKAWEDTHEGEDLNIFTSFRKSGVPLTAQSRQGTLAMPFVKVLVFHEDFCAKCGMLRATRAEIQTVSTSQVQTIMQQSQQPQQF